MPVYCTRTPTGQSNRYEAPLSLGARGTGLNKLPRPGVKVFVGKHVMSFTQEELERMMEFAKGVAASDGGFHQQHTILKRDDT